MLYVLRHGEVDLNVKKLINFVNNGTLTKKGILQSTKAGKNLKNKNIDLIICSPLKRVVQTMNLLELKEIPIKYDSRLLERNSKSYAGKPFSIIDKKIWYDFNKLIVYNDNEGFKSITNRVNELLEEIKKKYKNKNVLIITSGDICKAIYLYFNEHLTVNEIIKFRQGNCEIKEYKI